MTPQELKARLEYKYPDGLVEVFDMTGTQDHYQISVESGAFEGLSRIQQQRHVMDVFASELKTGEVHALTIKTITKQTTEKA